MLCVCSAWCADAVAATTATSAAMYSDITPLLAAAAGILGENLALPQLWTEDIRGFIIINATTLSVCVGTFFWMWRVMARKKLI